VLTEVDSCLLSIVKDSRLRAENRLMISSKTAGEATKARSTKRDVREAMDAMERSLRRGNSIERACNMI
jgi:hypothetical protein